MLVIIQSNNLGEGEKIEKKIHEREGRIGGALPRSKGGNEV